VRSGIELPGETRGLVKPPARWQPTTIGSIPMGQEIAVTPIQLVTMASAIANGGVYLPPHIVLENTNEMRGSATLRPATFHAESELPDPLPAGAHRVISEMTSAEMRKMMEDVVLFGTGTTAQLNGYSAAGKTGTAQKIDPVTRTYSHTKYVASFVGFAPVSDPAITVAVIMDSPTRGSHFGHEVSAPVFQDLAQQILEYLGVQHDQDLKPVKELAKKSKPVKQADPEEHAEDLQSLFAEVNNLPADDPLRNPVSQGNAPADATEAQTSEPAEAPASGSKTNGPGSVQAVPLAEPGRPSDGAKAAHGSVTVAVQRVAVPSFAGKSLREVVEQAGRAGLGVQIVGSGIARDQAPAAGTMVPAGTEIVVRFAQ
jgi:cell division protein FtsI (penicillin-binding protein 3)